jgi:hypothetical protein
MPPPLPFRFRPLLKFVRETLSLLSIKFDGGTRYANWHVNFALVPFRESPPDPEPQATPQEISTGPVTAVRFASINVDIRS